MNSLIILALLLTIPVGIFCGVIYHRNGPQYCRDRNQSIVISGAITTFLSLLIILIQFGGNLSQIADKELISGQITHKTRKHDHYQRPYECMCTTDDKGNRSCSTCYEDRYTVQWAAQSTIGEFEIKKLDHDSRRVYLTPDPDRYAKISKGDPVAAEQFYKNYMKGIPKEFLYNDNLGASPELIATIPDYPKTYDFYHVNRVINLGVLSPVDEVRLNFQIANELRTLGIAKEVNIILVVGKYDPYLVYAVREKWQGGKKNDVIVVLGMDGDTIRDAKILTWDKNHYFKIKLQDVIMEHGRVDPTMMEKVFSEIKEGYTRPQMKDYEELREHIETPAWAIILIFILLIATSSGFYFLCTRR